MKIDTETLIGKIQIMQAFDFGNKKIEIKRNSCDEWNNSKDPAWDWVSYDYRIKAQTVEEAAVEFYQLSTHNYGEGTVNSFKAGVEWRDKNPKEQDNE